MTSPAAPNLYLGVDAGGTKTSCAVLDPSGRVLGEGTGPAANLSHVDPADFCAAMQSALNAALHGAGSSMNAVSRAFICLAGFSPSQEEARVRSLLDPIFHPARCSFRQDIDAALASACGAGSGLVVIAGTGSVAYGRRSDGVTHRSGGWGYLIGDEGSAYWLGAQALRCTLHGLDGRRRRGPLLDAVVARVGTDDPAVLDKRIYREKWKPPDIAAFAPLVIAAAQQDDMLAVGLVVQAAVDLAEQAIAVIAHLGIDSSPCGLVGGLWKAGSILRGPFREAVASEYPHVELVEPSISPAEGAALLALYEDGIKLTPADVTR